MTFEEKCKAMNVEPGAVRDFVDNGGIPGALVWVKNNPGVLPVPAWVVYAMECHQRMMQRWW